MSFQKASFTSTNGETEIAYFTWSPSVPARGVVQIVHGMCEYMGRYNDLAEYLADKGYVVCGHDQMGHGQSVGDTDTFGYFGRYDGAQHLIEDVEKLHRITKESYPKDLKIWERDVSILPEQICRGGSCVVDPYGHYLSEPVWDDEAIILADLDMTQVYASRMEHDPCGHYARPDVLELKVKEEPN